MARQTFIIASAIIPASPERVWEIACDTSRYPEWVENTLRMIRTDGPTRVGATMEELTRIAGPWKSVTRWRVTEFDPPRRQVQQGEGVSTAKGMAVIIELSAVGQDTNFTLTVRYTPRFGPVGALIDRAVRGSITRSQQRSARASPRLQPARAQVPEPAVAVSRRGEPAISTLAQSRQGDLEPGRTLSSHLP